MGLLVADPPITRDELEAELGDVARLDVAHLTRHQVVVEELHAAYARPWCCCTTCGSAQTGRRCCRAGHSSPGSSDSRRCWLSSTASGRGRCASGERLCLGGGGSSSGPASRSCLSRSSRRSMRSPPSSSSCTCSNTS